MKNRIAQVFRLIAWIIGILLNAAAQLASMPTYFIVDTLAQVVGRSMGALLISFLLLLPLKLFKRDQLRNGLLPYFFAFISLISLIGSLG